MIYNNLQYALDREKEKPKIRKARKRQREIEKKGHWEKVEDEFKPYYKFVKDEIL